MKFTALKKIVLRLYNFYIKELSQKSKSKLNSKIANKLKIFSNQNSENIIKLEISSNKKINVTSKDSKGDPSKFQMTITLNINILSKNNYKINSAKKLNQKLTKIPETIKKIFILIS